MIAHIICETAAMATEQLPSIKTIKKVTMKQELKLKKKKEMETEPDKWRAKVLKTKCKNFQELLLHKS